MDYRDSHRQLQDQFDTRRLADRLASVAGDDMVPFRDFNDFSHGSRLRVTGEATSAPEDPLVDESPGAKLVVRVRVNAVFPNCRRYVHTHGPTQRSVFVPVAGEQPPVPDWKLDEWFDGTLPAGDPALDAANPSAPAIPRF